MIVTHYGVTHVQQAHTTDMLTCCTVSKLVIFDTVVHYLLLLATWSSIMTVANMLVH